MTFFYEDKTLKIIELERLSCDDANTRKIDALIVHEESVR